MGFDCPALSSVVERNHPSVHDGPHQVSDQGSVCHFGYGIVLLSLFMRGGFPVPVIWVAGFVSTGFGFVQAASSIAMTSEILYLIPKENKSLATGFWLTLWSGGSGLSGVLFGQLLG